MVIGISLILVAILLIIGILLYDTDNNYDCIIPTGIICGGITLILGIFVIVDSYSGPNPKAIDVYRGNTELQITQKVVNNVVVSQDTTVVWKK